jgi:hypothetical protein
MLFSKSAKIIRRRMLPGNDFLFKLQERVSDAATDSIVPTKRHSLLWSTVSLNDTRSVQEGKRSFRAAFLSDDIVDNTHHTMLRSAPTEQTEICH